MYYQMTTQGHTNMLNEGYCDTIFFIICYMMDYIDGWLLSQNETNNI